MEHDPEIALRNVELLADFAVGPFLDRVELEDLRHAWRQFAEGQFKVGPEFGQLQPAARRVTLGGHIVQPENGVISRFVVATDGSRVHADGAFATGVTHMVPNLMAQDAHKPGALGGLGAKTFARFEGGQESLLNEVFRHARVANLADRKIEQIIPVGIHPLIRTGNLRCRIRLCIGSNCHSDSPLRKRHATTPPSTKMLNFLCKSGFFAAEAEIDAVACCFVATTLRGKARNVVGINCGEPPLFPPLSFKPCKERLVQPTNDC